jgi:hypothetical protein
MAALFLNQKILKQNYYMEEYMPNVKLAVTLTAMRLEFYCHEKLDIITGRRSVSEFLDDYTYDYAEALYIILQPSEILSVTLKEEPENSNAFYSIQDYTISFKYEELTISTHCYAENKTIFTRAELFSFAEHEFSQNEALESINFQELEMTVTVNTIKGYGV